MTGGSPTRRRGATACAIGAAAFALLAACSGGPADAPAADATPPSRPSTTVDGDSVLIDAASTTIDPAGGPSTSTLPSPPIDPSRDLYVSIGDSYAQGYQPSVQGPDGYRHGYAYLVPGRAATDGYDLALVNFGCGGATVGSLAESTGCPGPGRSPDGPSYEGTTQLDAALELIAQERDRVALVTVSIGGNDLTSCTHHADPAQCVDDALARIGPELAEVLTRLREAAGPDTVIVGLTYPDVVLGELARGGSDSRAVAEQSVVSFRDRINPTLAARYEAVGATFVDVTAATGAYTPLEQTTVLEPYGEIPVAVARVCELTWFCENQDIHPRDAGHEVIADLIVATLPPR